MNIRIVGPNAGKVEVFFGRDVSSDAVRKSPASMLDTAIRAVAEITSTFVDSQSLDSESHVTVVLSQKVSHKRIAPAVPFEFYEARMALADLIRPLFLPADDCSLLRTFQKEGVRWLIETKRGILADDMGLGKTVQAIFALRQLIRSGHAKQAMVVCPGILVPNWSRELARWGPELGVCIMRPPARNRAEAWRSMKGRMHVLLTTYEQVRAAALALKDYPADVLILDEAHRLRNPRSLTTAGIRGLSSSYSWALTGTPIERHPADLVSLLSIVAPGRVGSSIAAFGPVALRTLARPFLLRRHKRDVLTELPQSDEKNVWLELTPEQHAAYKAAVKRRDNRTSALSTIAILRKICDIDPISGRSAKIDYFVDRAEEIVSGLREKAVVFSVTLPPLIACRKRLADIGIKGLLLTGRVPRDERENILRDFRHGAPCVLLASAKLASEGLTLTEANHVFFLNLWWNPSANYQARDRVLRIGQEKHVSISNLLCADTLDEELYDIVQSKQHVYNSITEMLTLTNFGTTGTAL